MIHLLQQRFRNHFVGKRYGEEMARTYSASRTVFNRSVRNDVNMRVFEALACGSLLVTNDLRDNGQAELFQDGVHLATYCGPEELLDKIAYYLDHEAAREKIAAAGRQEAIAKHTYRHRMEQLLTEVERQLSRLAMLIEAPVRPGPRAIETVATAHSEDPPADQPALVQRLAHETCPPNDFDPGYFEFARPEVLALIPLPARSVLDIGCGAGRLGEALKARQQANVTGVEMAAAAAVSARPRLDEVITGDIENLDAVAFAPGSFDAVVCADVLEHLRDPEGLLRRIRTWLRPGGQLIASLPNVRHHSVVRSLLDGNWTYEPAGLLDRTHLQFFTRRDLEDLFTRSGFAVRQLSFVPGAGHEQWQQEGRPPEVRLGRIRIRCRSPEDAEEFFVYQHLLVAGPTPEAEPFVTNGEPADTPAVVERPASAEIRTPRPLRIMYLGDFSTFWRHEAQTANALLEQGHEVTRFHEHLMPSVDHVVQELNSGRYDCLLFYKGRIASRSAAERFTPTGEAIAEVTRRAKVPCYPWYVDRAFDYKVDRSREAWMRLVAPLCRIAFVADGPLAKTNFGRWHVLREPINPAHVQKLYVPEEERRPLAFVGEIYGSREEDVQDVRAQFPLGVVTGVYGSELSRVIQSYKVILGPRFPCVPGYWGNRVYVVLAHGGFFLAPEIEGMREEGIMPGVHYAPLGNDPVADIRMWLDRPKDRERIARAGQDLVASRFTYENAVRELCRVIEETL